MTGVTGLCRGLPVVTLAMNGDSQQAHSHPGGALQAQTKPPQPVPAYASKGLQIRSPLSSQDPVTNTARKSTWEPVPRKWELADFKPVKKLYRGYASKVYLAEDCGKEEKRNAAGEVLSTPCGGRKIVLKVYDLLRLSPLTKYQLDREVRVHSAVEHKNIIRLVAAFTQVCRRPGSFFS